MVKNDGLKAKTDQVRAGTADKGRILPYVTFSGTFSSRANEKLINYSGYFCIDLDHIDIRLKDTLAGDTFINPVLIFVSPRGGGLKLVIFIENGTDKNQLAYFESLQKYFSDTYQLAIDVKCKDVARACFLCYCPEAYFNPEGSVDSDLLLSYLPTVLPTPDPVKVPTKKKPAEAKIPDDYLKPSEQLNKLPAIEDRAKRALEKAKWTFAPDGENCTRPGKDIKAGTSGKFNRNPKDGLMYFTNFSDDETFLSTGIQVKGYTSVQIICLYDFSDNWDTCIKALAKEYLPQQQQQKTALKQPETPPHSPDSITELSTEEPPATRRQKLPPTPPLPIGGMPDLYQEYITTSAKVFGTHQDYHAGSVIEAVSVAIGSHIELFTKYANVPILWMTLVGDSAAGKSKAQSKPFDVIQNLDNLAYRNFKRDYDDYDALEPKIKHKQKPPVMMRQYIIKDITPEALQKKLALNDRGTIYLIDELMGMILNFNRYGGGGEQENLLTSFDRGTMTYNRKSGGSDSVIIIHKPVLYLFGGIQPARLWELGKGARIENGFISRFCHVYPDTQPLPDYNDNQFPEELEARYEAAIMKMINLPYRSLTLSAEAKKLYAIWYNENQQATRIETSDHLRGAYQKLNYFVLRLAIVFYCMNLSTGIAVFSYEISEKEMRAAISVTEYFRATAKKINEKMFEQKSDADTKKTVIQYLNWKGHSEAFIKEAVKVSQPYINKVLHTQK